MPEDTPWTDDYVAALLTQDAKDVSSRTATGSRGGVSKRPASTAKPNTRFLRNILRDTDAHNAALLAREEEESKARLRALDPKRKRRAEQQVYSVWARREGGESFKRRKVDDEKEHHDESRKRRDDHKEGRSADVRRVTDGRDKRSSVSKGHSNNTERTSKSKRSRGQSPLQEREGMKEARNRQRCRPRSRDTSHRTSRKQRSRSRSPARNTHTEDRLSQRRSRKRERSVSSASETSLGPRRASQSPPLRSRGRGVSTPVRTIDAHFEEGYDPSADVQPDEDADDWDQALEALKDRQRWKQKGADRLKAAGFSEAEVKKWRGGESELLDDFRWAKKGESREWDKGKELDVD
ncbi:hypothetical protein BDZ85DRAFT_267358 [Elsinoe ampelina]|uniref:Pre-mRNA-splicing factor 38B n=1 Tax=Elsinoe ampelina TaxID=302913 RepID=A0A6A6G3I9_9PEZI|nr:hypothetical protein BDZ85DRAFT_267358 [Elsinoe ampelina]